MSYGYYDDKPTIKPWTWVLAISAIVAPLFVLGWVWGWDVYLIRELFVSGSGQLTGVVLVALAAIIAGGMLTYNKFDIIWPPFAASGLALVVLVTLGFNATFATQSRYLPDYDFRTDAAPFTDYEQRVPYEIAERQVNNNMGDFMGSSYGVKSVSSQGEFGNWNALVQARGVGVGYEGIVSIDSPHYGNVSPANVVRCEFDRESANLRFGGWLPQNDLYRAVIREVYWSTITFQAEDVYGYCKDGTPIVVAPLVERDGFVFQNTIPWGVAVYNGSTGELTITNDADEIAKLDGPTYPISVARAQRESLQSYDGDWWAHVQGQLGWDVVGNSEIQLRTAADGTSQYFTGLQPRGASVAVVAEFTVASRMLTPGEYNPIRVNDLETPRDGDTAIADTIFSNYSYMPEFAGSKYSVYEIVPAKNGEWVASIGTDQSVVYRALISVDGNTVTLVDRNGNEVASGVNEPSEGGEPGVTITGELDELTEQELIALLDQITERLKELNQ